MVCQRSVKVVLSLMLFWFADRFGWNAIPFALEDFDSNFESIGISVDW